MSITNTTDVPQKTCPGLQSGPVWKTMLEGIILCILPFVQCVTAAAASSFYLTHLTVAPGGSSSCCQVEQFIYYIYPALLQLLAASMTAATVKSGSGSGEAIHFILPLAPTADRDKIFDLKGLERCSLLQVQTAAPSAARWNSSNSRRAERRLE